MKPLLMHDAGQGQPQLVLDLEFSENLFTVESAVSAELTARSWVGRITSSRSTVRLLVLEPARLSRADLGVFFQAVVATVDRDSSREFVRQVESEMFWAKVRRDDPNDWALHHGRSRS